MEFFDVGSVHSTNTLISIHIAVRFVSFRFLSELRPDVVEKQIALRSGSCNRCGECCKTTFFQCSQLEMERVVDDDGTTFVAKCKIYGRCQPTQCKVWPIDQRDIDELDDPKRCGFHFHGPPRVPTSRQEILKSTQAFIVHGPRALLKTAWFVVRNWFGKL